MAIGQVRDNIALLNEQGEIVENSFLNLGRELWDRDQKVLTLLFDPGRIKRGVGPNAISGSPLKEGNAYRLLVKGSMETAQGLPLVEDTLIKYQIGKPIRASIDIQHWDIDVPLKKTDAISISFDRLMDSMATLRLIKIVTEDSRIIKGKSSTNGSVFTFSPDKPWAVGLYKVVVSAELEDISGNTMRAPFDAPSGTIGMLGNETSYLKFEYNPNQDRVAGRAEH